MKTPLFSNHTALSAKMADFAGFMMPLWYSSIKNEHLAVRQRAGVFDISHMGLLWIEGEGDHAFIQKLSCNRIPERAEKVTYTMLLQEDGGILDDIMVGRLGDGFLAIVNASNKAKILAWMTANKTPSITISDWNERFGLLAIQGPEALAKIDMAFGTKLAATPKFWLGEVTIEGQRCVCSRTGYTGEDGCELLVPISVVAVVWETLVGQGVVPCGLAARDSLRLEAGLPLYGHELSEKITPLMTRYTWVVKWDHDFIGREALAKARLEGVAWTTVGIESLGRQIPRSHYAINGGGEVTSGTLSPLTDKPIALAMVPVAKAEIGGALQFDLRGQWVDARVVAVPFTRR